MLSALCEWAGSWTLPECYAQEARRTARRQRSTRRSIKRRAGNRKQRTASDKQQTPNHKQQAAGGKQQAANTKPQAADIKRQATNSKQQTTSSQQQAPGPQQPGSSQLLQGTKPSRASRGLCVCARCVGATAQWHAASVPGALRRAQVPLRFQAKDDPGRTRTCNPRLRRPMPYPLGHGAFWRLSIRGLRRRFEDPPKDFGAGALAAAARGCRLGAAGLARLIFKNDSEPKNLCISTGCLV